MRSTFIRGARATLTLGTATILFAGCASGNDAAHSTFRWGHSNTASSLDPHRSSSPFDSVYLVAAYDSLVRQTPTGELKPSIATDWTLSADSKTVALTLSEGRTFHDGSPLDAEAVKKNLERAAAPESSVNADLVGLHTIDIVDPIHLRLTFDRASGDIPAVLSSNAGMMINPSYFNSSDVATGKVDAGSGPFKINSATNTEVRYTRWDNHPDASKIDLGGLDIVAQGDDTTRLSAVRSGQLDATYIRPNQVNEAESAGLTTIVGPRTSLYTILLNTGSGPLASPTIRQALMHSVDRNSIDTNVYDDGCAPAIQPWPSDFFAYDSELADTVGDFDIAKARQLLAQAGYPNGFDLEFSVPAVTTYTRLAEVLQDQLSAVGIKVTIKNLDSSQFVSMIRGGNYQGAVAPIDTAKPDPSAFLTDYFLPGGNRNAGNFEIPGLAAEVGETRTSTSNEERAPKLRNVVKQVLEFGPPIIPVCVPDTVLAHRDRVQNLQVPLYGNYDFHNVTIGSSK